MKRHLIKANQMMEDGQYEEAEHIFNQLSRQLEEVGIEQRAAMLAARAAQAAILAGQLDHAAQLVKRASRLHAAAGNVMGAVRTTRRALDLLTEQGHPAEAQALKDDMEATLKKLDLSLSDSFSTPTSMKKSLPAECESCRGPVRPDEVRWLDDDRAECTYCGSVLKAE